MYWACSGTNLGAFLSILPTGKDTQEAAISMCRNAGGRIVEVRGDWDRADIWQQLGLIPGDPDFNEA